MAVPPGIQTIPSGAGPGALMKRATSGAAGAESGWLSSGAATGGGITGTEYRVPGNSKTRVPTTVSTPTATSTKRPAFKESVLEVFLIVSCAARSVQSAAEACCDAHSDAATIGRLLVNFHRLLSQFRRFCRRGLPCR